MTGSLRVLIADDHAPVRESVRQTLDDAGFVVCAEVANANDAISVALREHPDICLLDVRMPGNGILAVAEIASQLPDSTVVMLTVSAEAEDLFDALTAGAAGYLLKDMDPAELPAAVRAAVAGEAPMPGWLAGRLVEEFRRRGRRTSLVARDGHAVELPRRAWDVLELLAAGLTTTDIARRLAIDAVTVRRHISELLRKLGVSTREEAVELLKPHGHGAIRSDA